MCSQRHLSWVLVPQNLRGEQKEATKAEDLFEGPYLQQLIDM
jgi:hypothetical protein